MQVNYMLLFFLDTILLFFLIDIKQDFIYTISLIKHLLKLL